MRRLIASVSAALLMCLLAAPADAARRTLKGPVQGGGSFKLVVKIQNGKATKAGKFEAKNIPVSCDDGPTAVEFSLNAFVPVDANREFAYDFGSFTAHIDGKINRKEKKATGELSYGPNDIGSHENCTTNGLRGYTANAN